MSIFYFLPMAWHPPNPQINSIDTDASVSDNACAGRRNNVAWIQPNHEPHA